MTSPCSDCSSQFRRLPTALPAICAWMWRGVTHCMRGKDRNSDSWQKWTTCSTGNITREGFWLPRQPCAVESASTFRERLAWRGRSAGAPADCRARGDRDGNRIAPNSGGGNHHRVTSGGGDVGWDADIDLVQAHKAGRQARKERCPGVPPGDLDRNRTDGAG